MKNSNFFFCYNKTVSDFLKAKGVKHVCVAQDVKTSKIFSLFEITNEFQAALAEYKALSK
jgi:hypothetical protein